MDLQNLHLRWSENIRHIRQLDTRGMPSTYSLRVRWKQNRIKSGLTNLCVHCSNEQSRDARANQFSLWVFHQRVKIFLAPFPSAVHLDALRATLRSAEAR